VAAFVTVEELTDYLAGVGESVPSNAAQLIEMVSAVIQALARGQEIELHEDDELLLDGGDDGVLFLPQLPVIEVSTISVGDADLTSEDFVWYPDGRLERVPDGAIWTKGRNNVAVTYSHGLDPVPDDIKLVCLQAIRELAKKSSSGVSSKTIGKFAVTYTELEVMAVVSEWQPIIDRYALVGVA
jgi:hypothetical protein